MAEEQVKSKLTCPRSIPSNEEIVDKVVNTCLEGKECLVDSSDSGHSSQCNDLPVGNASKHSDKLEEGDYLKYSANNEKIVEDLKKDFEEVTIDSSKGNDCAGKSVEGSEDLNKDEKPATKLDDDFIDEDFLKTAELSYSEDDKKRLRAEAESLKSSGNEQYKSGEYVESVQSYTLGLRTCPLAYSKDRAILYANRAAAKVKLSLKSAAIEDCSKAVELDSTYLKAYFRRAQLYEETEKLDEALADYQNILRLDPLHREALYAHKRLPDMIQERNEKMKADMLAKLKDLGNMILRPFNLSTDNFQLNQDPNTGGYSVNFVQNKQ